MFSPSLAQYHAEYRQAELLNALATDRLIRSARENAVSSIADRPSIARRIFVTVTDALSGVGGAIDIARTPLLDALTGGQHMR